MVHKGPSCGPKTIKLRELKVSLNFITGCLAKWTGDNNGEIEYQKYQKLDNILKKVSITIPRGEYRVPSWFIATPDMIEKSTLIIPATHPK